MSSLTASASDSSAGAELLRRELSREVDLMKNTVREYVQKKKEQVEILKTDRSNLEISLAQKKRELEKIVIENDTLVETVETLKRQVLNLTDKSVDLEENLRVLKYGFECRIVELEEVNKELSEAKELLASDIKCKDMSLALLQENILFSRQNTEAANKTVQVERKAVEALRTEVGKLKSENEFQDLQIKSLTKQLEIDNLAKEVVQLRSQIKRKHEDGESGKIFVQKLRRSENRSESNLVASKRNNSISIEEEMSVCSESDIASNYDPEEEVEEEFDFLESMKGEVESIFSHRMNNNNCTEYYVKWKNLSYAEATWEEESFIKTHHQEELDKYDEKRKSKTNPKSYCEAMKLSRRSFKPMKEQPGYIGGTGLQLRNYQLRGISFLLSAWHRGDSVILADERGLGKTIQAIGFLQYLFHNYKFCGPMLVCVPVSSMAAWQVELCTWAPGLAVVCYAGDSRSRKVIRNHVCENSKGELTFNILLTDYELVCKDSSFFKDIVWSNIVLDEAHRLKDKGSMLYKVLMCLESHHRLLLTGSPPLNNLEELWCMLTFLKLENIAIGGWEEFEAAYGSKTRTRYSGHVKLLALIKPVVIRRRKKGVGESLPWLR